MSPAPVTDAGESSRLQADVLAGGAVCWRERGEHLEVLMVHRPKYRDWSWPKGKTESGETLPECAVREIKEETGYSVTLGLPLPDARYAVGRKQTKHVSYWACEITTTAIPQPDDPTEIDKAKWFSVEETYRKLTRYSDREQLDALVHAHEQGYLRARPFIIVRHGKAFPRSRWHETEHLRPLLALGTRQAMALTGLLAAWSPEKLVCSPWKRCMATLTPYSASSGTSIKVKAEISEKAHSRKPRKVVELLENLMAKNRSVALCTHRPVLPTVMAALAAAAPEDLGARLPSKDPYLAPGEILVAYIKPGPIPRIVDFERFRPIDG